MVRFSYSNEDTKDEEGRESWQPEMPLSRCYARNAPQQPLWVPRPCGSTTIALDRCSRANPQRSNNEYAKNSCHAIKELREQGNFSSLLPYKSGEIDLMPSPIEPRHIAPIEI